jgi:hypothetical protein
MKKFAKIVALSLFAAVSISVALAGDTRDGPSKSIRPDMGKITESEPSAKMTDPNFGYEGHLGTFVATEKKARCMIVVHEHPDTSKIALGNTKLVYEGTRQLNNVPCYVFKTEWDGKTYPSKVFLSSEKVYFGGGISGYIAADYRDASGWAWKLIPLRRMEIVNGPTKAASR